MIQLFLNYVNLIKSKIKNELEDSKKYIKDANAIAILTMIPEFIVSTVSVGGITLHSLFMYLAMMLLILISRFSKAFFSFIIIYINLVNIVIWNIFVHWGYQFGNIESRIEAAIISPSYEMFEYLKTYVDYRDELLIVYTFFVLFLLYKFIVSCKNTFKIVRIISFVAFFGFCSVFYYRIGNPFTVIEPFSIPYEYKQAINTRKFYNERLKFIKNLKTTTIKKNLLYDKIVIIQGEAVNKHHMSIYNYDKNTTPFLSSLKSKNKLYIFNAIAPTNQTRYSVPIMHTPANVHNFKNIFLHSKSIIGDFNTYGYKTYWISNQGKLGADDTAITSIAQEADVYYFTNNDFLYAKPDECLLSYLSNIKKHSDKEMYVIHLIGSHEEYALRYTKKHTLFKNTSSIIEQYDNTIYNTDYVLRKIFSYFKTNFKNEKILFVYISDHGEVISKSKNGHGFLPPFKDEYDIPFIIYSNIENSRIDKLYKTNKKRYFNLENLNYIIEYISGMREDSNISYSSDVFALEPKNIFCYDNLAYYHNEKRLITNKKVK